MKEFIFIVSEIVLVTMAIICLSKGIYIGIFAPLIVGGYYYEEKIIAFEDKATHKFKNWIRRCKK